MSETLDDLPAAAPAEQTRTLADLKDLAVASALVTSDKPVREAKRDAQGRSYATGRRKNAIARVWIRPGKGEITVNGKRVTQYFARPVLRMLLTQPFLVTDRYNQFDVMCTCNGGGSVRPGRRGPPRHQPRADLLRAGTARRAEAGRVPDPRQPRGGA